MDIIVPELVWVEGRCYRFCDALAWSQHIKIGSYTEETYDVDYESYDQESCDAGINIIPWKWNYKHSFNVNSHFFGFIIGSKGATLKALQADTRTRIQIPKLEQKYRCTTGQIVITAANKRDIVIARSRIDLIIETSRSKLSFTHFVCIPLNTDIVKEFFQKFKEDVLKTCKGVRGIREEIFQTPQKLHLTIVMLLLLDEQDRKKAKEALEHCKKNIIIPILEKSGPISIEFKGLQYMNDDPSEVHVLYIQVHDESGCLQIMADKISDYYINKGLTKDKKELRRQQDSKVKLHLTVMNTAFFKNNIEDYNRKQMAFDATNIIKMHQDTFFGKINLTSMHISQIHSEDEGGFYSATAEIKF